MTEGYKCNRCGVFVKDAIDIGIWYGYSPSSDLDAHICQHCTDEFKEWLETDDLADDE